MAVSSPFAVGGGMWSSSTATERRTFNLVADATVFTDPLVTLRMPNLFFWFEQTGPPAINFATVQMQYTVRAAPGGGDEWLDLTNPIALVAGPNIFNFHCPAVKIRASLTRVAGIATTVDLVLGCMAS